MKSFSSSDNHLYTYTSPAYFHTYLISNLFAYFCYFWSLFPFTCFLKVLSFWSVSMYYPVKFVSWTVHELIDSEMFVKILWNSKCQITGLTPFIDRFHKLNFEALLDYHWDSEELVFEVAVKFTKAVKFIVLEISVDAVWWNFLSINYETQWGTFHAFCITYGKGIHYYIYMYIIFWSLCFRFCVYDLSIVGLMNFWSVFVGG